MLKVVVFDGGFGGELFADYLESELPVLDIVRVIDWRNAEQIFSNAKSARLAAEKALNPYLNNVDLIIFANHLLSLTSLKYFRHKYKRQRFVGIELDFKDFIQKPTLVLTTKAVARTFKYIQILHRHQIKVDMLDDWPTLIDDGELTNHKVKQDLKTFLLGNSFRPEQVVLGCGQFVDIRSEIIKFFGHNIKIIDGFEPTLRKICRTLKLRGSLKKTN